MRNGGKKKQDELTVKIQFENEYPIRKWKSNLKMEVIVHLKIGKKVHKNNENWGMRKKKKVCKTARRAHSQKADVCMYEN